MTSADPYSILRDDLTKQITARFQHTPKLNEALSAVQAELPTFTTDDQRTVLVEHKDGGSHSYKYVTLGRVIEAVAPIMAKHELSFRAMPGYGDPGDGKLSQVLRYTLAHSSGEQIDGVFPLSAGDKGIQGMGSAITYARRYCLAAVLNIAVEQDDDGMAAMLNGETGGGGVRAQTRGATRKTPARSNRPAERPAVPAAASALPGGDPVGGGGDVPSRGLLSRMFAVLGELAQLDGRTVSREERLREISDIAGREVSSSSDLTAGEVQQVITSAEQAIEVQRNLAVHDGVPAVGEDGN